MNIRVRHLFIPGLNLLVVTLTPLIANSPQTAQIVDILTVSSIILLFT
jgi:hypothetical protein